MGLADNLGRRVRKAVRLALNEVGRTWVRKLRVKCGFPWPPPSAPGDAPHYRSRTLQRSFKYKVKTQAKTIEDLIVYIDHATFVKHDPHSYNYSDDLEYGRASTNLLPRPYWRPTKSEMKPIIAPLFHSEFQRHMGELADAAGDFDSSDGAADFPASGGDSGFPE